MDRQRGARKVMTEGGAQDVQIYRVNDIWRMNVEHYKGANESAPLTKGGDERKQGADERSQGGDESAPTKNNKTIEPSVANAPRIEIVSREEEENPKAQPKPKYPHSRQVFGWFPAVEPSWQINTTECKHAELLYIRGESAVKAIMKFCAKHESDEFFPKWRKPSSLERNWPEIQDFAKRNGL